MKGIRKCRKWLHAHPRFRKGLLLGILVLGVDVGAAACAGGETFSLVEEAGVQSSATDVVSDETGVQSSTMGIVSEGAATNSTELLPEEVSVQDTADVSAEETSAGNTSDSLADETSAKNGTGNLPQAQKDSGQTNDLGQTEDNAQTTQSTSIQTKASIYVYVTGAVVNPGVYSLPEGARIYEAVAAAGGLREDAAAEYVNQASFLGDGEQIYFPTREEAETGTVKLTEGSGAGGTVRTESLPQDAQGEGDPDAQDTGQSSRININTADKTTLQKIPGVGEKKAEAILAYRNAHGAFGSIEEIKKVAGIKEASFQKMKDSITVE